jgi:hypothetical protein
MKSCYALRCPWYTLSGQAELPCGRGPLRASRRKLYMRALPDPLGSLERHPGYPASKINVAASREAETYPNISFLFMCLQRELGDDSLVDTWSSIQNSTSFLVELT